MAVALLAPALAMAQGGGVRFESPEGFFAPGGKRLRGYYGGAVHREEVVSSLESGSRSGPSFSHTVAGQSGGDFRLALYADGTARAELLVLDVRPSFTGNEPFQYEGRYTLRGEELRTSEMELVNSPDTFLRLEESLVLMRVTARHVARTDSLVDARVLIYSRRDEAWEDWTHDETTLAPPAARRGIGAAELEDGDSMTQLESLDE